MFRKMIDDPYRLVGDDDSDIRGYFLVNYYLSDIQRGIQGAHALGEMALNMNYELPKSKEKALFYRWLAVHKTMVFLNGGNQESLINTYNTLRPVMNSCGFPISTFYEDRASLNNSMTCVAFVAPASFTKANLEEVTFGEEIDAAIDFIQHLRMA